MSEDYAIHWFRRDLRIEGNALFFQQVKKYQGKVLGVFIFDPEFLSREDFSHRRFDFFLNTIKELKKSLTDLGSDLLVLNKAPLLAWEELLTKSIKYKPKTISFNRDYEPFAVQRDKNLEIFFNQNNIETKTARDHLLIEPDELLKEDKTYYKVFTPFSKKWKTLFAQDEIQKRITYALWMPEKNKKVCDCSWKNIIDKQFLQSDQIIHHYQEIAKKNHNILLPVAGHHAGIKLVKNFQSKLHNYEVMRDIPAENGTSQCSIYLKNGSITTSQIIKELKLNAAKLKPSEEKFLNEIIWREFYYHLIFHEPKLEHITFQKKYSNLPWEKNHQHLQAWKMGLTGFPIVDAGMRQLEKTGWMHNRVRMIVASFLCKDLLISYKEGEKHFMKLLLDGDLAPNNGGWQWAASTGCDAQPYFRIFNPWTQGKRFDPEAAYIKKFIPELKDVSAKDIHTPNGIDIQSYPKPIVSHEIQRVLALKIYNPQ